jgi:3',5'-nucleoside bisphosphate phosphatase
MKAISITDHNTIDGSLYANYHIKKINKEKELEIINGIEITTKYKNKKFHFLGYMYDNNNNSISNMKQIEKKINQLKQERRQKIINLSKKEGYKFNENEIKNTNLIHDDYKIGTLLIKNKRNHTILKHKIGYKINKQNPFKKIKIGIKNKNYSDLFFEHYFSKYSPHYIKKDRINLNEISYYLKKAKGLGIIAHPMSKNNGLQKEIIDELFLKNLINGYEIVSVSGSKKKRKILEKYLEIYNPLKTGGSDYHNKKSWIDIGHNNPKNKMTYNPIITEMKKLKKYLYN